MNTYKVRLEITGNIYNVDDIDDYQCVCDTAICADYGNLELYSFERQCDHIHVVTEYFVNIDAETSFDAKKIAENLIESMIDTGSLYYGELENPVVLATSVQECI